MEWITFWSSLAVAAMGIGGVILGQVLSNRRERDRSTLELGHKRDDAIRQELLELYVLCLDELQDSIVNADSVGRLTEKVASAAEDGADKADIEKLADGLRASMERAQSMNKLTYKVDLIGSHEVRMCFKEIFRVAMSRSEMDAHKWSNDLGRLDTKLRVLMRRDLELHRPSVLNVNSA